MENRPWGPASKDFSQNHLSQEPKMSMMAMATPSPHPPFRRDYWDEPRVTEYAMRPRSDADRVALPSIRQIIPNFPELQLRIAPQAQDGSARTPVSATSPAAQPQGILTPEYVHSPTSNKRRRLSNEDDEREDRASRVPRLYNSPPRSAERSILHTASPDYAPRTAPEQWSPALRTSPHLPNGGLPAMRSPVAMEPVERQDTRPTLPSFPSAMGMDRGPAPPMPRMRGHSNDDYLQDAPRPLYAHPTDPRFDNASYRQPQTYAYACHHPSRMQSLSMSAIHPLERTPFSAVGYGAPYGEYMRFGDMAMGVGADNKQRKRRGNLPKETTDKLRAWFVGHLHHPYPTEDEKQELMRQTGLQMNQISNWFINARRRQLPAMMSNAHAERDAMSRGSDAKVAASERGDFDDAKNNGHSPATSDGGDSGFDDDLDLRRRSQHLKRGGSY